MSDTLFSYKLRPVYNGHELLLEFNGYERPDELQRALFQLLEAEGFQSTGVNDLWMNDEAIIRFRSENSEIEFSRNNWDFIFLLGNDNQTDIHRLDELLSADPRFRKEEVNDWEYRK